MPKDLVKIKPRRLPLNNITPTIKSLSNSNNDSGPSGLSGSPMSCLAVNLSELSTGRSTPKLRRKLSLSNLDTPPHGNAFLENKPSHSVDSGWFSGSPLDDSPTLERKKTFSFRRFSSEPPPAFRFDSPTDFLDEIKDESNSQDDEYTAPLADGSNSVFSRSESVDDVCSQDSGLGMESDRLSQLSQRSTSTSSFDDNSVFSSSSSLNHLDRLPSLEDVWNSMDCPGFKAPQGKAPKRRNSLLDDKVFNEDTCSPIKYSPVKSSMLMHRPSFSKSLFSQIPEVQEEESTTSSKQREDDGFTKELYTLDDVCESPAQVSSLMCATLLHQPEELDGAENVPTVLGKDEHPAEFKRVTFLFNQEKDNTPSSRPSVCRPRGLHRSQSLDIRRRPSIKRAEPSNDMSCDSGLGETSFQTKRFRSNCDNDILGSISSNVSFGFSGLCQDGSQDNSTEFLNPRRLHRCHSETEAMIKSAVSRMFDEPDLIGDCSKPYFLPTVRGKHQDLKSISSETLSQLIEQQFCGDIEEFHIIDCRYPYEYDGGHIKNALNLYTKDAIHQMFLKSPLLPKDTSKRSILIFHCEFSSERGPGLFRYLRQQDRDDNKECYPNLHYPEIYLLEGGYKKFFENYSHLCEPQTYKTMFDKNHSEDLRKFRAKCKSEDKGSKFKSGVRTLKF